VLCLVTWLWYVNPYLLYVFTAVIFITSGKRIRIIILLYCVISTYDAVEEVSRTENILIQRIHSRPDKNINSRKRNCVLQIYLTELGSVIYYSTTKGVKDAVK